MITTRGKLVFVAESFDLDLARNLTTLVLDAQGTGELKMARLDQPGALAGATKTAANSAAKTPTNSSDASDASTPLAPLSANLVHFFADCGVMKAAVGAATRAIR